MGRKEQRKAAKKEKSAVAELCKVQRKYVPQLFELFEATADPRNPCYITYSNTVMLGQMFFKRIAGIVSMQGMTQAFNDKTISKNLTMLMGCSKMEYLPHHVTENEYLERLDPKEIEKVIHQMVYSLLRRRTFEDARYKKKWLIIVDGTQTYSGNRQINENCLERHYDKGTENEHVNYHLDVLEAKIYLGDGLVCSIASEFIENSESDRERYRRMSEEQIKQDCELKAFVRLAAKIKKCYPRLPILLLGDSLYACDEDMPGSWMGLPVAFQGWEDTQYCRGISGNHGKNKSGKSRVYKWDRLRRIPGECIAVRRSEGEKWRDRDNSVPMDHFSSDHREKRRKDGHKRQASLEDRE